MENTQGSSFIPKNPVRGSVKPRQVKKVYIFSYIAVILFFVSLLAAAATFFYTVSKEAQLSTLKEKLAEEQTRFNHSELIAVKELDERMDKAYSLLQSKVSLQKVFKALEETTVHPVQIIGFEYKKEVNNDLNLALAMKTHDFNSALFQKEIIGGSSVLKGASFNDVKYNEALETDSEGGNAGVIKGEVTFMLTKTLTQSDIPFDSTAIDIETGDSNSNNSSEPYNDQSSSNEQSSVDIIQDEEIASSSQAVNS